MVMTGTTYRAETAVDALAVAVADCFVVALGHRKAGRERRAAYLSAAALVDVTASDELRGAAIASLPWPERAFVKLTGALWLVLACRAARLA